MIREGVDIERMILVVVHCSHPLSFAGEETVRDGEVVTVV